MSADRSIPPFHVMDILARAKAMEAQGKTVVHMEIGEPDFPSPQPVIDAGIASLKEQKTFYTPAAGLPELREAIGDYYRTNLNTEVSPEQVIITPGASGALQLVFAHLLSDKNTLMIADPNYPCNRNLPKLFGAQVLSIPVSANTQYHLNKTLVEEHWRDDVAAVLIASPSNPTGAVCSVDQLLELADFLATKNSYLIVDEIYQGLTYQNDAQTVAGLRPNIFVLNSFSKYFGMTGWRVGWLVAPQEQLAQLDAIAQNTYLAAATVSQHAALAVFQEQTIRILEERREIFKQRRDLICETLIDMQIDIPVTPQGAFYIYADVAKFTNDSFSFCKSLLEEKGVAITPGIDFGDYRANEHIRFAFTTSEKQLLKGMQCLSEFLNSR